VEPGDRVYCDGREGTLEGVFCEAIGWVRWDGDGWVSYAALADLSVPVTKALRTATNAR
jgi:hypothetical protein